MSSDKIRLTGLWKREAGDGSSYLSGQVTPSMGLLIFPNKGKEKDSDPDFVAFLTPGKEGQEKEEKPARKKESWP